MICEANRRCRRFTPQPPANRFQPSGLNTSSQSTQRSLPPKTSANHLYKNSKTLVRCRARVFNFYEGSIISRNTACISCRCRTDTDRCVRLSGRANGLAFACDYVARAASLISLKFSFFQRLPCFQGRQLWNKVRGHGKNLFYERLLRSLLLRQLLL